MIEGSGSGSGFIPLTNGSGSATLLLPVFLSLSSDVICFLIPVWYLSSQSTYYKEYHSVWSLVGIGTPSPPLPQASVPTPNQRRGGGEHSPAGKEVGESQIRKLEKKLSTLSTLCLSCPVFFMSVFFRGMQNYLLFQVFLDDLIFALLWYISFVSVTLILLLKRL